MQWSDVTFRPDTKTLREFAGLWILFFGGLALWEAFGKGHGTAGSILAAVGLAAGLPGLIRPQLVRPLFVATSVFTFPIGWVISQAILVVLFYGLFTPIGLIFRLMGRDALERSRRTDAKTYWAAKPTPTDPRRYFQQY